MTRRRDVTGAVLLDARERARAAGSGTVEAEHLLMALAARKEDPAASLLAECGLGPVGVEAALAAETERSLAAVGVDVGSLPIPVSRATARRTPRTAASAKDAVVRATRIARSRRHGRVCGAHLLVAILQPDLGTVPRALDAAGVDRPALRAGAERLLSPI